MPTPNAKEDVERLLAQNEERTLLRLLTCGSVDDGKSTLIGRLMYDTQRIYEDQLSALKKVSTQRDGGNEIDLALLTDGLKAEREQGITIDVAHRFFSTERRKFIIADTPGHEQYTRNMATGASESELAVLLVDATRGVQRQTRRHAFIVSLLGINDVIFAINKIDAKDYDAQVYRDLERDCGALAETLSIARPRCIPVSALKGDNVVTLSEHTPYYDGPPLLELLETIEVPRPGTTTALRFPVQLVTRTDDFRGFAGSLVAGEVRPGDAVMVLPSRRKSTVARISTLDGDLDRAFAPMAVTLALEDEIDISRGDVLVPPERATSTGDCFDVDVVWMHEDALIVDRPYRVRVGTRETTGTVSEILFAYDVDTLERAPSDRLTLNGIARVRVQLEEPVPFESYERTPDLGGLILIDRISNLTLGAGMIRAGVAQKLASRSTNVTLQPHQVTKAERAAQKGQTPFVLWLTGLSGAGKSTIANAIDQELTRLGHHTALLDGDNVRHGLNKDLDFSDAGRKENIRRIGEVAKLFVDAGIIVITAFISPFRSERQLVREMVDEGEFIEVFVDTPLEVCEERDPKGLYKKARAGEIANFTGVDSPYEVPRDPDLVLDAGSDTVEQVIHKLLQHLEPSLQRGR